MYHDFRRVVLLPEFKYVVFHRMVHIGRCPSCQYIEWKCASAPLDLRTVWQEALATHHQIQIAQKQCYAADRAKAASGFSKVQLYVAMDCGSGHEFILPQISSAERAGPNKLLDNVGTVPMQVCNGIVHGDRLDHVILSPGVIGATANHIILRLVLVNTVFEDHGVMPEGFTLQCDGASTNKCIGFYVFGTVCCCRCIPTCKAAL